MIGSQNVWLVVTVLTAGAGRRRREDGGAPGERAIIQLSAACCLSGSKLGEVPRPTADTRPDPEAFWSLSFVGVLFSRRVVFPESPYQQKMRRS